MREINKIAEGLFEKIRDRFEDVSLGDDKAKATQDPEDARFFNFDYEIDGKNYGNITISIIDETSLKVYFSKNISHSLTHEERDTWYAFLRELREFAKRNMLSFEPRDITRSTLKHRDIQQASKADDTYSKDEVVAESLYGTRKSSYEKKGPVKIILRHSDVVDETKRGARAHKISSILLQNKDGERFKLPENNLRYARAMARHLSEGGSMHDDFGQHITKIAEEIAKLRPFKNNMRRRTFEDQETQDMMEAAFEYHGLLNNTLKRMTGKKGYTKIKEHFTTEETLMDDIDTVALKEKFVKKIFDDRLESALPIVQKAYEMKKNNKFANYFENWANDVAESWDQDEEGNATQWGAEPIDIDELGEVLQTPLPIGVDAINAISAVGNIIQNDELENKLVQVAKQDPEADARDTIINWLQDNVPAVYQELMNEFGDADVPAEPAEQGEEDADTMSEGAEFGAYDYEQLAQAVYDENPNLDTSGPADEVIEAGRRLGGKSLRWKLRYDEDFPSDFVSAYAGLQKENSAGSEHGQAMPGGTENMLEGEQEEYLSSIEAVQSAIIRRIIHGKHHNLLMKLGPDGVMDAAAEQAEYVGPVEEIGSSDVSGWIRNIYATYGIPLEDHDQDKDKDMRNLEEAFNREMGESYDSREAYDKWDPKHPDFVKNYQAYKEKHPDGKLADFINYLRSRAKTNEGDITLPDNPDYSGYDKPTFKRKGITPGQPNKTLPGVGDKEKQAWAGYNTDEPAYQRKAQHDLEQRNLKNLKPANDPTLENVGDDVVDQSVKLKRMGAKPLSTLDKLKNIPQGMKAFAKGEPEDDLALYNKTQSSLEEMMKLAGLK